MNNLKYVADFSIQGCYNGDYANTPLWWLLDSTTAELVSNIRVWQTVQIAKEYEATRSALDSDTFMVCHNGHAILYKHGEYVENK